MSTNTTPDQSPQVSNTESSTWYYIIVGICTLCVVVLIYYSYRAWVKNADSSDGRVDKDDPVMDFNLKENIDQLEKMQNKILDKLSKDTGL